MADLSPIRVAVSGAAGRIAYALAFRIATPARSGVRSPEAARAEARQTLQAAA